MPFSSLSAPAASVFAPLFALFSSSPTKARLTPSTSSSRLSVLVVEEAPNGGGSGFALPPSSSSTRNDALTRPPSSFTLSSLWKGPTATFTLHDWDSTPEFLRTPFILTSYRVLFPFWLAARSFFLLHNETVNVWTHTVGALYLAYLLLLTQGWSLTEAAGGSAVGWWDRALFFFFHLSALLCFACSTAYHWFGCMSVQAHSCLYIGDMSAIGALILGSYVPGLYYAFYCRPVFQIVYIGTIVSLVSAYYLLYQCKACHAHAPAPASASAISIPGRKSTSARQHSHWVRVLLLVSMVAFAVVPAVHFVTIVGVDYPGLSLWAVLAPLLEMLALYALGFAFYVSHWPERVWPRTFDVWLSSHQFWHVLIVQAVRVWHFNLMQVLAFKPLAVCTTTAAVAAAGAAGLGSGPQHPSSA